jgi:hypothetical protein
MFFVRSWRPSRLAAGAAAAVVVTSLAVAVPITPAFAAVTGNIVVTSPTTGKVAAATEKQLIFLKVDNLVGATLTEETVAKVDLGPDDCDELEYYIVTSTSTIVAKTPTGGCTATASGTETITISFTGSTGDLVDTTTTLQFVTPPAIAEEELFPVVTENSAALDDENQVQRFLSTGGQYVRIKAGEEFAFSGTTGTTGAGLSATLGGKALTEVKAYDSDGVQLTTTPPGEDDEGNYFIGKTASAMNVADPTLVITQNGVSKSFSADVTGISIVTAPLVTGVSPALGKVGAATSVTISGSGFTTGTTVTFCGIPGTTPAPATNGNSMTVKTPVTASILPGLGDDVFAAPCPVVVTQGTTLVESPISDKSVFTFVAE